MTDNDKKSLPEQLRDQLKLSSWNRNPDLLEEAAQAIENLKENISTNNEFFGGQLKTLNMKVAELKQKLKRLN